jgi:hypothetical protein
MKQAQPEGGGSSKPTVLSHPPGELTSGRLKRLGEGIGKVVYASDHWVVKRQRSPSEVVALIVIWKLFRSLAHHLPGRVGHRMLERPSKRLRLLRVVTQAVVLVLPRSTWLTTHIGEILLQYRSRDRRGERLAKTYLEGSSVVPQRITFPPARVKVGGWPGWLTVSEASERVEATLHQRLVDLAREGRYSDVELWLVRFLEARQRGWQHGVFSVDAHLKNFGVIGDRIVLLDPGGLTDSWTEIESRLTFEEVVAEPHIQLGLGSVLGACPDVAERFNARWKSVVNAETVLHHWPDDKIPIPAAAVVSSGGVKNRKQRTPNSRSLVLKGEGSRSSK